MRSDTPIFLAEEEVRLNFWKTIILLLLMIACIFGISWFLGKLCSNVTLGLKIGFLVCIIIIPLELMFAKFAIVSLTGCVPLDLNNPAERRLQNIVEGISISAGLRKVPDVYLLETMIPNAFAAGWNEQSALIGITTGLADMMDDQELEGVIAHEISHIVHHDTMICQMALALNSGILILCLFIRWVSMFCAVRSRDLISQVIFWLLFIFIYPFGVLAGLILCAAISRKREFSADAFAVRLCSYNEGLARALEKLKEATPAYGKKEIDELGGGELECLFFYFPEDSLLSTHPPIEERITKLRNMY